MMRPPEAMAASPEPRATLSPRAAAMAPLFSPISLPALSLNNRLVMAPMTRKFSRDGVPGPDVVAYYQRRAAAAVGLIITEGTAIEHPAAAYHADVPSFFGAAALDGWRAVLAAVHASGGAIVPQLWHVGTLRNSADGPTPGVPPVGPSGLVSAGRQVGEPMSEAEIWAVVEAFGAAAATARAIGFDGVEIHGAHGYLIDQFLWHETNCRDDAFGGDLHRRTRFAAEAVAACRRKTARDFPILFRLSQWKLQNYAARLAATPNDLESLLRPLVEAGVDVFDCSMRWWWKPEFEEAPLNLAGWVKKLTGKPVIMTGGVGNIHDFLHRHRQADADVQADHWLQLQQLLDQGHTDLVGVGRPLLADPSWALKVREGRFSELHPYAPEALSVLL